MSASEQTSASKRERGLYHVRMGNHWTVAEYTDHHGQWRVFNNTDQKQSHHFDEIGERIERPSPQQQPDTLVDYEIVDSHNGTVHLKLFHLPRTFVDRVLKLLGRPDELSKAQEEIKRLKEFIHLVSISPLR